METSDTMTGRLLRDYTVGQRDFQGWSLAAANLCGAQLAGIRLCGANLSGAELAGANLTDADLEGAQLVGARLSDADLTRINLAGANLQHADLSRCDLAQADLQDADLRGADLQGANLRGANMGSADFNGADLTGTDLSGTGWETALPSGAIVLVELLPEAAAPAEAAQPSAAWAGSLTEWPEVEERIEEEEWALAEEDEAQEAVAESTAGMIRPQAEIEAPELEEEPIAAIIRLPIKGDEEAEEEAKYGI